MSGCMGDPSLRLVKTAPLGMTRDRGERRGPSTRELWELASLRMTEC